MKQPPTLMVPLRNRSQWFEYYYHREGSDGIFVPGDLDFGVGETLYVDLNFLEEQRSFRIRGAVTWRRVRSGRPALKPGIGVEFDASERATRDKVLEFAAGRAVDFTLRTTHRIPVTLQLSYRSDSQFLRDVADDVSAGGLFITSERLLDVGTIINLKLKPPRYLLGVKVKGVVAWLSRRKTRHGMGIRFLFENERSRRQIEKLVERLKASIIRDMRIRVPRPEAG